MAQFDHISIYYSSMTGSHYINCACSRWDQQDKNLILETWLTKSQLQTLQTNTNPGAVAEMYNILTDVAVYHDMTWNGTNTIMVSSNNNYQLSNVKSNKVLYVKNMADSPIEGDKGWINVKIDCVISGGGV